jgi:hypothetical protein
MCLKIVTTSQLLDPLLQHSHETLQHSSETSPTHTTYTCNSPETLPVGHHDRRPKLLLLAVGERRPAPPVSSRTWPWGVKPWPPASSVRRLSPVSSVRRLSRAHLCYLATGSSGPRRRGLPLPAARGSAPGRAEVGTRPWGSRSRATWAPQGAAARAPASSTTLAASSRQRQELHTRWRRHELWVPQAPAAGGAPCIARSRCRGVRAEGMGRRCGYERQPAVGRDKDEKGGPCHLVIRPKRPDVRGWALPFLFS